MKKMDRTKAKKKKKYEEEEKETKENKCTVDSCWTDS